MPHKLPPDAPEREVESLSPEARKEAAREHHLKRQVGPGSRFFEILRRVLVGTWNDGFIHAGNLAYLALLALFPFFIFGAAVFSILGDPGDRAAAINAVLLALPPVVGDVIEPVARNVIDARSGWLLWVGALVGLWTASSLIETIRDILRRAYGTRATHAFWQYRLFSAGLIFVAIILLLLSLFAQVLIGTAQEMIQAQLPWLDDVLNELALSRIVPAVGLFASLFLLFYWLTPHQYRRSRYPKWPGAAVVTAWWMGVTAALPPVVRNFFSYDLTYGSLAGIMIALFFFWLVGLGMVVGAELNAALAETPEEEEELSHSGALEEQEDASA